ncbi:MAG: hypothetical protein O3C21_02690 [Verrucomicrobia bacterium]|nr:hypothetical protein [Verrucomicrobiota bacterium]
MIDSHGHPIVPGPSPEEQEGFAVLEDDGRKRMFDYQENVRLVIRWFTCACVFLALLDVAIYLLVSVFHVFPHAHHSFEIEGFPMFYPAYGFVACVLLVLVAKQLRRILMRNEDYYDS